MRTFLLLFTLIFLLGCATTPDNPMIRILSIKASDMEIELDASSGGFLNQPLQVDASEVHFAGVRYDDAGTRKSSTGFFIRRSNLIYPLEGYYDFGTISTAVGIATRFYQAPLDLTKSQVYFGLDMYLEQIDELWYFDYWGSISVDNDPDMLVGFRGLLGFEVFFTTHFFLDTAYAYDYSFGLDTYDTMSLSGNSWTIGLGMEF